MMPLSPMAAEVFAYAELEPGRWEVWNRETKIRHVHLGTREHVEAQLEKIAERWKRVGRNGTEGWRAASRRGEMVLHRGRPKTDIGRAIDEVLAKPGSAEKTVSELAPHVVALVPISIANAMNRLYAARRARGESVPAKGKRKEAASCAAPHDNAAEEPRAADRPAGASVTSSAPDTRHDTTEDEMGAATGERVQAETKAAYVDLERELGRAPTYKELAVKLDIGDSAASQRLAVLRRVGVLPRVARGGKRPGTVVSKKEPAPSSTSAPAGEGVVADLRARRVEIDAALKRIDGALAALGA